MTTVLKFARIAVMNTVRRRILIGRVECISHNGAAKCGGAVASEVRINPDASSPSMRPRTSWRTSSEIERPRNRRS